MALANLSRVMCSASFDVGHADALPTEFRIFKDGPNPTSKGVFLCDPEAAAAVLAAYRVWGVDLMIDLNHDAVDANAIVRADAGDARGWFKLEQRGGEVWAVDVRWTPDGERRLREKTQRYISPYFAHDEDGRVCEIINLALVAMPATHDTPALVAASRLTVDLATRVRAAKFLLTHPKRS